MTRKIARPRSEHGKLEDSELDVHYREKAWSVYSQNQDVFTSVLRRTGPWRLQDGMDLVHDFVVDRLPQALTTFDSARGPIKPWLFTVFGRYARRRLREISSLHKRWTNEDFAEPILLPQPEVSDLRPDQTIIVRNAVNQLPEDQRMSLSLYFGKGRDAGSLNAIARKFDWSKHKSKQTILKAIASVAALIEERGILTTLELDVCRARLVGELDWESIAVRIGKTEHQIQSLLKSALQKLSVSLGK